MPNRPPFSESLLRALHKARMRQTDLALKLRINRAVVSSWCSGRHVPRQEQVAKINAILDVDLRVNGAITPEQAAKDLHKGIKTIQQGLINGDFPFGRAVKMPKGNYEYVFFPQKYREYVAEIY